MMLQFWKHFEMRVKMSITWQDKHIYKNKLRHAFKITPWRLRWESRKCFKIDALTLTQVMNLTGKYYMEIKIHLKLSYGNSIKRRRNFSSNSVSTHCFLISMLIRKLRERMKSAFRKKRSACIKEVQRLSLFHLNLLTIWRALVCT